VAAHTPFRGVYAPLMQEYARGQRRIVGGAFAGGERGTPSTWGYDLFSDRLDRVPWSATTSQP
jgi:hypothetical protein